MDADDFALARGRFFARIDRMISEVSVADTRDVVSNPVQGSPGRAYTPADGEFGGKYAAIELCGDWSWRPENQVQDPGYAFTAAEIEQVNFYRDIAVGYGANQRRGLECAMAAAQPRPWMVPAYSGRDLQERPARIGPRI